MTHATSPCQPAASADARMTAERDEIKYLVPSSERSRLSSALHQLLPHHRFTGKGASSLPLPRHFVTTIYFDTPSRRQYFAARRNGEQNAKLRAKDYYDIHPSLAEHATDPRQLVRHQSVVWLELKTKHGVRTGKHRLSLPKRELAALLSEGPITPAAIERLLVARGPLDDDGELALREIRDYCRELGEPLHADCLVHYRRLPWQDAAGTLRVTLDVDVAYYPPRAELFRSEAPLVREALGAPCGHEPWSILEVKCRAEPPDWLRSLLSDVGAQRCAFSKFERASTAVHA